MAETCNLCAKPLQKKVLLNEYHKGLIDMLLNWLKYKHDNKLYEKICEECHEEISRINKFLDVIKKAQMIHTNINSNDTIIKSNTESNTSSNASLTHLSKRPKVAPKRFSDDSIILSMKPIKIITNNNAEDTQQMQLIAKLHVEDQPQMILADVNEVKINDSIKCSFTCTFCQKEYDKVSCLKRHVAIHLQNADKQNNLESLMFNCVICKKTFKQQYAMRRHFKNAHNTEKLYKCEQCSAAFKYKYNLHYHVARHNNDKPFKCLVCNKTFILHYELQLHTRTHTGEKPHMCLGCGHSFAHRSNLVKHQRLCCKFKELNQLSQISTQSANNKENEEINEVNDKVVDNEAEEVEEQMPSVENLASSLNPTNDNNDNTLVGETDSNVQIYLLYQQQRKQEQKKIREAIVGKVYWSNSESLLKSNIAMKCTKKRTNDEDRIQATESTNDLHSKEKDLISCNDTNMNPTNNNTNDTIKELIYENSTDLCIAKKTLLNQTKELDPKFLIRKVEILPTLNVTTKTTLPIQNLMQMPTQYKYQCMSCFKYFKRRGTLRKHLKTHTEDQSYQCRDKRSQILSDSSSYSTFRSRRASYRKVSQTSPLSKSPLNVTCLSPTCSIVSDPDPDGREIMQMIKTRANESTNDSNSSSDGIDDNSLSSSSLENTMWEEALDKVLFQPAIMQNIRNNLSFTLNSAEQFM